MVELKPNSRLIQEALTALYTIAQPVDRPDKADWQAIVESQRYLAMEAIKALKDVRV